MIRRTLWSITLAAVATAGAAAPAAAQWALEGRVGSALPTGELTTSPAPNQTAGLSFAADAMYSFSPRWTGYLGASRQSFNCDGCTTDVDDVGVNGGLKYILNRDDDALFWVRGGLLANRASVDGVNNEWGVGVDSGIGVDWRVNHRFAVVPALRVSSYNSGALSLTYFTMDLGLHLHLDR